MAHANPCVKILIMNRTIKAEKLMNKIEKYAGYPAWSMGLLLIAFAAGCDGGRDSILGAGGATLNPAASLPAGSITPAASCSAASGPTIPTVTASDPSSGNQVATTSTSGVANNGKLISANFSLAMDAATITATSFTVAPVGGAVLTPASVSYDAATQVATLTTAAALDPNTFYTAVITQAVTSAASTPLACIYAWNFKTVTPAAAGLPPVNLGLATPFAIASAAGVTNTGATTINGDTVLDVTAAVDPAPQCNGVDITADGSFGPCASSAPTINGTVISDLFPADAGATAAAIKADLLAAYNSITPASLTGGTTLECGTIGTGGGAGAGLGCAGNSTLPPGVYTSLSSIGVTGVLTLDAQGDTNAQFIFQAGSTLTTAAGAFGAPGSEIILINGAKASNVWWQVGSSATIGLYSVFKGNVLADTSITANTGATSCGRLLAGAITASGAFTFDTNVVSMPGHASAPSTCQ